MLNLVGNVSLGVGGLSYAGQFNILAVGDADANPRHRELRHRRPKRAPRIVQLPGAVLAVQARFLAVYDGTRDRCRFTPPAAGAGSKTTTAVSVDRSRAYPSRF